MPMNMNAPGRAFSISEKSSPPVTGPALPFDALRAGDGGRGLHRDLGLLGMVHHGGAATQVLDLRRAAEGRGEARGDLAHAVLHACRAPLR